MKPIILCLLAIVCFCEETKPLPESCESAISKYEADMAKAKAEYDKEVIKMTAVYVRSLERAQATETKKGNLEGALAIKEEIDRATNVANPETDLLGNPLPGTGTWVKQKVSDTSTWHFSWGDGLKAMTLLKPTKPNENGRVGEGQTNTEFSWTVNGTELHLLDQSGSPSIRFTWNETLNRFDVPEEVMKKEGYKRVYFLKPLN